MIFSPGILIKIIPALASQAEVGRSRNVLSAGGDDLGLNYRFKGDLPDLHKTQILEPELISMEMTEHG